jgi:hypothetical protein
MRGRFLRPETATQSLKYGKSKFIMSVGLLEHGWQIASKCWTQLDFFDAGVLAVLRGVITEIIAQVFDQNSDLKSCPQPV